MWKRVFSVFTTHLLHKCGEVECRKEESPDTSTAATELFLHYTKAVHVIGKSVIVSAH